MDLNITKQEKQALLARTEITAEISFEGPTPSRYEIVKAITKKLKLKQDLTVVKHIYTNFGSNKADVEVYAYNDSEVMKVLEKKVREIKAPKEEPKPVEKTPAETPKEEIKTESTDSKPVEPVKEE